MIDSHTHLDYFEDADERVAAAVTAGVHGMVSVGCGAASIRKTLEIARRNEEHVRVVAGVHPNSAAEFDVTGWSEIEQLCADELVVGIGETGFDQYRDRATLAQQQPAFELQADLARRRALPLIIHTRAADEHTLEQLARHADGVRVVLHCFSLSGRVDEVIERGYWCSFAGNVTYPSAQDLRDAAAALPADKLMVETDAPYLAPVPRRGKRNEPLYVVHTLACIAQARGISVEEADALTTANATALFGLPASMSAQGAAAGVHGGD
jgi:TatD DNase family protein